MTDEFSMRGFNKSDIDSLAEFKRKSVKINLPDASENSVKNYKKNLLKWNKKEPEGIKIAEKNGEIAGYIWLNTKKRYGLIRHLFVKEKFRREGLAKKLFFLAENYFKKKKKEKIRLTATLKREWLVEFYERMGYEKKRVIMEKDI